MMYIRYFWYVLKHKWFVFVAGLQTKAPLWRLLIHDWSKFSVAEFGPYARRFFSGRAGVTDKTGDPTEFQLAWSHHWHLNPHHWEYWVDPTELDPGSPLEMPEHFVREMVADWMGAGRAITGKWDIVEWYEKNKGKMQLHPDTRTRVDLLLAQVTP